MHFEKISSNASRETLRSHYWQKVNFKCIYFNYYGKIFCIQCETWLLFYAIFHSPPASEETDHSGVGGELQTLTACNRNLSFNFFLGVTWIVFVCNLFWLKFLFLFTKLFSKFKFIKFDSKFKSTFIFEFKSFWKNVFTLNSNKPFFNFSFSFDTLKKFEMILPDSLRFFWFEIDFCLICEWK